jgi:hypothetical protein
MYFTSTLVGIASYATLSAATAVSYIPELTAPLWRISSRGLASVSMLLEALNTLAVSQKNTADGEVAALWALVMTAMARIGAWDANVACALGHVHIRQLGSLSAHYHACMAQCRRWLFSRDEQALVEAEAHVASMLLIIDRPHEPASFTECILCVLRTLLRFHRSECASSQWHFFARGLKAACARGDPNGDPNDDSRAAYAAHTTFWLASHVYAKTNDLRALVDALGISEAAFDRRVQAAHCALLELRI